MRFGAKGLMSTLMRVRISSDAPRCTVQFGALDPRCTMVQVHGDPNQYSYVRPLRVLHVKKIRPDLAAGCS